MPANRTSCKYFPYNLTGEAESLIKSLVQSGTIMELNEPSICCAAVNLIRKPEGNLRLVTDFRSLKSKTLRIGYPFPASTGLRKKA